MKRLLFLIIIVFASVLMACGDTFTYNGIKYVTTSSNTVGVTKSNCSGDISIPENVVYKGKTYSVTTIDNNAFYDCSELTSVIIGNNVTSIGHYAFWRCSKLTSVTIGNSVTTIGYSAFQKCRIKKVEFPPSLKTIGDGAFSGCFISDVVIPKNIREIGPGAFSAENASDSIYITIEDGNEKLSFTGTCFSSPYGPKYFIYQGRETDIASALGKRESLYGVTIGDSVKVLSHFDGCSNMTYFKMGKNVEELPSSCFKECRRLKEITLPSDITKIPSSCFEECYDLDHIDIPNKVTLIGNDAFTYSAVLKTCLIIPKSVEEIGDVAFAGHVHGDTIIFESPTPPKMDYYVFQNTHYNSNTVYVPQGSFKAYKALSLVNCIFKEYKSIDEIFNNSTKVCLPENTYKSDTNKLYDINGIYINNSAPRKGIYIKNGKKVFIK